MNATIVRTLSDTSVLQTNLEKAVELAQSSLSLIRNRYELDGVHGGQFFLTANNMKAKTWDMIKYKFLIKILGDDKVWLSIFGGSSVTAGHDNYYDQAYPFIFDKRMSPILEVLGVKMHTIILHRVLTTAHHISCATKQWAGLMPTLLAGSNRIIVDTMMPFSSSLRGLLDGQNERE